MEFFSVILCLMSTAVICGNSADFKLNQCAVKMTCDTDKTGVPSTGYIQGKPGKRGPKGEKGDSCRCDKFITSTERCAQTKYLFPRSNQVADYIRVKPAVPMLTEFSLCMVVSPVAKSPLAYTLLSYATPKSDNTIVILFIKDKLRVYRRGKESTFDVTILTKSHLCVTLSTRRKFIKVFVNGASRGVVYFKDDSPLEEGGILIVGQEQDAMAGKFDPKQAFKGEIENFMMWYRVLSDTEIISLYRNRCECPLNYDIALTIENVQLEGAVTALPVLNCD